MICEICFSLCVYVCVHVYNCMNCIYFTVKMVGKHLKVLHCSLAMVVTQLSGLIILQRETDSYENKTRQSSLSLSFSLLLSCSVCVCVYVTLSYTVPHAGLELSI